MRLSLNKLTIILLTLTWGSDILIWSVLQRSSREEHFDAQLRLKQLTYSRALPRHLLDKLCLKAIVVKLMLKHCISVTQLITFLFYTHQPQPQRTF